MLHSRLQFFFSLILCSLLVACKPASKDGSGPIEAKDALATFEIEPGFEITLIAAEPLVADPVDMEIDEYGRLYVLQMHGYPLDKSGRGKINLLSDTDGDGVMDSSVVFADGLILPFGIMRWKKGLIVADAPEIFYMEDTTGDGRADIKEAMLTGFAFSNAQMNAGNPVHGLDNWIYLTSEASGSYQVYKKEFGDFGSDIYFPASENGPRIKREGSGRTIRFRPDDKRLELTSGTTQFGHGFDAWGHHILGDNSNHVFHEVIAAPYLNRNPDLLVPDATETLSDHGSDVFAITKRPQHQLLTSIGIFTSACGNTIYTGGTFPPGYNNRAHFVAEPVSNVVHADILNERGVTFSASRAGKDEKKEFLASTDSWFRPVNMYVGPDGALYLLDYYRQIIEHPEWMSEEAVKSGTIYNGMDRGRIYRIAPAGSPPPAWTKGIKLGDASNEELARALANPNAWWRQNAQRLLIDRKAIDVAPYINRMATQSASALGRLHALWTLEGMGELNAETISVALKDTVAGIRENAIKLAELHLSSSPELQDDLISMTEDPNPKVRFQLLCTLGFVQTSSAEEARNTLLFNDLDDKWVQIAALSAPSSQSLPLLNVLTETFKADVPAYASMIRRLAAMTASKEDASVIRRLIRRAISAQGQDGWQGPLLDGLAEGIGRKKSARFKLLNQQQSVINAFFDHRSATVRQASLALLRVVEIDKDEAFKRALHDAVVKATNTQLADDIRAEAIHFLALSDLHAYDGLLKGLIKPQEEPKVQLAALRMLSLIPGQVVTQHIIQNWETLTPEIRPASLRTFLASRERMISLLDAIDAGRIQKASIPFDQSVYIMTQSDEGLRRRARAMFAHNDEENINKSYDDALRLEGDPARGKEVYLRSCSMCHQVASSSGVAFGPDLGTIRNWEPEGIMANILAPNLSIAAGYELWSVETHSGESFQGIISSETPVAISISQAGNNQKTINRADIASIKTLDVSAMPAGLEANINHQEMADLIAFLRQNK